MFCSNAASRHTFSPLEKALLLEESAAAGRRKTLKQQVMNLICSHYIWLQTAQLQGCHPQHWQGHRSGRQVGSLAIIL